MHNRKERKEKNIDDEDILPIFYKSHDWREYVSVYVRTRFVVYT